MKLAADMAQKFLKRFWIVTVFLGPLLILSETGLTILELEEFVWRKYLQLGLATVIFYFSLIFFQHAWHEIKNKKYGMMTLVSVAVGAGYLFSAASTFIPALETEFYLEIATLIWVLLFGHFLEARSSSTASNALKEVAKLLPQEAHLLKDGKVEEVKVSQLKKADIVLVKPGEKVPADGKIIKGQANFDESLITGESKPVTRTKGGQVIAGSVCLDGSVEIKLQRVGENSTVGQIQDLIAQAQKSKPKSQQLADKAAGWLTLIALLVSLATVLAWSLLVGRSLVFSLPLGITVLVISCPHALGLAIPTVSTIATALAVKNGFFLKDLGKIEVVKDIDWVVFDKTGTLTKGKFGVTDVNLLGLKNEERVLEIAASLEQHSSHPLALAIKNKAKEQKINFKQVDNFKNIAGKGVIGEIDGKKYLIGNKALVESEGVLSRKAGKKYQEISSQTKTVVFLTDQSKLLAVIAVADQVKEESALAVKKLRQLGIKVAMITGDNYQVAKAVAEKLSIDDYFAEVLPEEKYKHIKKLQDQGKKVMMVGDGVNDAPALTQADIGVAIGAGTDIAVEAGDVVLVKNNPQDIVRLIVLGKKVYRKMVENLIWATGYNIVAIPAAAGVFAPFGFFLKPALGAIIMSLSTVIVVINALRLKKANLATNALVVPV